LENEKVGKGENIGHRPAADDRRWKKLAADGEQLVIGQPPMKNWSLASFLLPPAQGGITGTRPPCTAHGGLVRQRGTRGEAMQGRSRLATGARTKLHLSESVQMAVMGGLVRLWAVGSSLLVRSEVYSQQNVRSLRVLRQICVEESAAAAEKRRLSPRQGLVVKSEKM
jgi:hypothetical protein